jgi:CheY-like chemotaxis protein
LFSWCDCAILGCSIPIVRDQARRVLEIMLDNVPILLAEDNKNEVILMRRAFEEAGVPNPLIVVKNGREVVEYLAGQPGLMLLDLKMPWMDGFDVLSWLRRQPQFDALPVVLMTSSKLQPEVVQSRLMGVYDYRVKPHDFEELVSLLAEVRKCWLDERSNRFGEMLGVSASKNSSVRDELSGPSQS